ncbi:MAG: hypothetical protein HYU88_10480, partial [Chloroflexi bacterium]|nr:hypothetical protein [Chloroflexota bacterium]
VAAGLLATGQWYLHFSRAGWENVHTALYALLAAWALAIALERVRLRWFAVAGAAAALGLYGYFAGRLVLPALLAYAPCALRWAGARWRRVLLGYAVLATTAVLLFLPQVPTIAERWEEFSRRTDAVDVLRQPRPYLGEMTDLGVLRVQLQRTLAGFVVLDGELFANGRYGPVGQPPYDPATGALFALGVALGLRRWRATALWWSMLAVPLLATQVLSAETPDAARAIVVAPFVYLFVALALDRLLALAAWRSRGLAQLALLVGVAGLAVVNVRGYFAWIASPAAAEARQPAVELAEYDLWRETLRRDLRAGGFGFNVGQWHAVRPAPPSVQPEPPGPRLSPTDGPRRDAYRLAGLLGEGHLRDPRGLAVDPDGTLYVADAEARAVLRFAATGEPLPALGAGLFGEPVGVAVRPGGDLDVLDAERRPIRRRHWPAAPAAPSARRSATPRAGGCCALRPAEPGSHHRRRRPARRRAAAGARAVAGRPGPGPRDLAAADARHDPRPRAGARPAALGAGGRSGRRERPAGDLRRPAAGRDRRPDGHDGAGRRGRRAGRRPVRRRPRSARRAALRASAAVGLTSPAARARGPLRRRALCAMARVPSASPGSHRRLSGAAGRARPALAGWRGASPAVRRWAYLP